MHILSAGGAPAGGAPAGGERYVVLVSQDLLLQAAQPDPDPNPNPNPNPHPHPHPHPNPKQVDRAASETAAAYRVEEMQKAAQPEPSPA